MTGRNTILFGANGLILILGPTSADIPVRFSWGRNDLICWEQSDQRAPVVVFGHGGGWFAGAPTVANNIYDQFTNEGYTFVSIGYDLLDYDLPSEQQIHGPNHRMVDQALQFKSAIEVIANRYPLAPSISLIGYSTGAQLMACTALRNGLPSRVGKIVLLDSAAYDWSVQCVQNPGTCVRLDIAGDLAEQAETAPVPLAAASAQAFDWYIAYGDNPERDTATQAGLLKAALDAAPIGHTSQVVSYQDNGTFYHNKFMEEMQSPGTPLMTNLLAFLP